MERHKFYGIFLIFTLFGSISFSLGLNLVNIQVNQTNLQGDVENLNNLAINITSPGDLTIDGGDTSNHTISWTLNDTSSYDYLGVYSFTEDAEGTDPANWTIIEEFNTSIEVIAKKNGHSKVVELWDNDNSNDCYLYNNFAPQTTGSVEFWIYGLAGIESATYIRLHKGVPSPTNAGPYLKVDWSGEYLRYYSGGYTDIISSSGFSERTWHHIRVAFNCTTDTFDIWVNGIQEGTGLPFANNANSLVYIDVGTSTISTYGNTYTYIDAVDYSWAPGYYQNRNMDIEPVDYLGLYSFTEDAVGSDPSGWTMNEPSGTNISVESEYKSHRNVLFLDDDSSSTRCYIDNYFTAQTSGSIEFWFLMPDVSTPAHFQTYSTTLGPLWPIYLAVSYDLGGVTPDYLAWNNGAVFQDITQLFDNTWYHLRINFECGTGNYDNLSAHTFNLYLNGVQYGPFNFYLNENNISRLRFNTYDSPYQPSELYLDAVDYSWAPGYYTNRNMDVGPIDYLGTYSFTEDPVGADPSGWIVVEDPNTNCSIIEEKNGHHKVMQLDDNMVFGATNADNSFGNHSSGTIEMWVYADDPISDQGLKIYVEENESYPIYTIFETNNEKLVRHNGTHVLDICNISNQVWHHLRYTFECGSGGYDGLSADQYNLYVDGVKYGPFIFRVTAEGLDELHFASGSTADDGNTYIDAVDYSWTPGYYTNRNMDYEILNNESMDYLGAYSYTQDADGALPIGWTENNDPGCTVSVISEVNSHKKVMQLYDGNITGRAISINQWGLNVTAGSAEWYWRTSSPTSSNYYRFFDNDSWVIYFVNFWGDFQYWDGSYHLITTSVHNQWYHIKVDWISTGWQVWIDGVLYGSGYSYTFASPMNDGLDRLEFHTIDIYTNFYNYYDAVDYSWAPGYYPNRNLDDMPEPLSYAVFEDGNKITNWLQWSGSTQVDYNVSAQGLGFGVHNISLVYIDTDGQWYHDDVSVDVNSTVVADWNVPSDIDIDIDLRRDRDCDIIFNFQNTGNATLIDLNFSISSLPAGWSVNVDSQTVGQLNPNETIQVSFTITVPANEKEFLELITINFEATVLETGQDVSDEINVLVAGAKSKNLIIWLVIIIGSVAAAASTSFVVVRRRRVGLDESKWKGKGKSMESLKQVVSSEFPGTYSMISVELMERINRISGLTEAEKNLLIQDVVLLDDQAAEKWIEEFEKTLLD